MAKNDEYIKIDYEEILFESGGSYFIKIEGGDYWIPFSLCLIDEETKTIEVVKWKLEQLGLY